MKQTISFVTIAVHNFDKELFYKKEGYLWQEGNFKMDVKHGSWIRYKSDGSVESKAEFENGIKKR